MWLRVAEATVWLNTIKRELQMIFDKGHVRIEGKKRAHLALSRWHLGRPVDATARPARRHDGTFGDPDDTVPTARQRDGEAGSCRARY